MRRETAGIAWLFTVALALVPVAYSMDEAYDYLAGSVHLDSHISGGDMKIEELVRVAKEQGSHVVIITDNDNKWVTYGLWPFRNLIRHTRGKRRSDGTTSPGIKKYGSERYIREIESAGSQHEIIAIHGTEAVPYYRWEGRGLLWRKPANHPNEETSDQQIDEKLKGWRRYLSGIKLQIDLKLKDWHRHLLVIGLKNAKAYEELPSVGNNTFPLQYNFKGIVNLWPILLVIVGIWRFRSSQKKKFRTVIIAGMLIVVGSVGVWKSYPFFSRKHQPYHDAGETPYQDVINYVNEKNGMVFWAHPEGGRGAENIRVPIPPVVQPLAALLGVSQQLIEVQTDPYEELLDKTDDYTGFAIFAKGMTKIGRSDGLWDKLLQAYCNGGRERPIWAIGETDFEGGGPPEWVRDTQTVFLIKKAAPSASQRRNRVLEAMRQGRMYATTRIYSGSKFDTPRLEFRIRNANQQVARMGETLKVDSRGVTVDIELSIEKEKRHRELSILIIRSRNQPKKIQTWTRRVNNVKNASVTFTDKSYLPGQTIYYRLLVYPELNTHPPEAAIMASNPIFINYE